MSDEARKRPGSVVGKALLLLGGLTLYVLSSGPVILLSEIAPSPVVRVAVKLFYLPLILASQSIPIFSEVWLAYLTWWGRWGR